MKKRNELKMGESVSSAIHFCHSLLDGKEWTGFYLDKSQTTCYDELSRNKIPWDPEKMFIFSSIPHNFWDDSHDLYEKRWVCLLLKNIENGETFELRILMKRSILDQPNTRWEVATIDYPLDKERDGERHFFTISCPKKVEV